MWAGWGVDYLKYARFLSVCLVFLCTSRRHSRPAHVLCVYTRMSNPASVPPSLTDRYDNCHTDGSAPEKRYPPMRDALNATGRPILYSVCEWGLDNPATWAPGAYVRSRFEIWIDGWMDGWMDG